MPESPRKRTLRIGELRQRLGEVYSVEQIRRLAKAGKIPGALKRDGKHLRFSERDGALDAWISATVRRRKIQQRSKRDAAVIGQGIPLLKIRKAPDFFPPGRATVVVEGPGYLPGHCVDLDYKSITGHPKAWVRADEMIAPCLLSTRPAGGSNPPLAPTWRQVVDGASTAPIFAAVNQRGWREDIYFLAQAIRAAIDNGFKSFFSKAALRHYAGH